MPTLFASFLYFDLSFMVWVMLGPLAVLVAKDIGLNAAQKGLIVATPVLAGAFLRIVAGVIAQHIGPKRAGILAQSVVILSLGAAWWIGLHSFTQVLLVGIALGVAGASFAIALPLTSQWYPPEHQGTALGIAGAGNSGTVLAALFAPGLAVLFGWRNVLGLAALPLVAVLVVFVLLAKDCPQGPAKLSLAATFKVLAVPEAWILMLFYSVTFGGFVGLASSLPIYFHDQYGLSPVVAGYVTAACVFTGSMLRPVGGAIADRIGGLMTLSGVYLVAFIALITVAAGLPTMGLARAAGGVARGSLGMGNGAVFQLVPQRFCSEVAVMTGLVGMTGGIGGFYLASSLGFSKYLTGTYAAGLSIFAGLALVALVGVLVVLRKDRNWALAVSSVPAE